MRGNSLPNLGVRGLFILFFVLLSNAGAAAEEGNVSAVPFRLLDCSYEDTLDDSGTPEKEIFRNVALPDDDVFRPLLADPKEPRFSGTFNRVRFRDIGESVNVSAVGFGGTLGLWGLRQEKSCNGLQINIFGAVFSQFNLDASSFDLINSGFQFWVPFTFRHGPFSARVRVFHQSSHVGDEFLLNNPGFNRVNLTFEMVEL